MIFGSTDYRKGVASEAKAKKKVDKIRKKLRRKLEARPFAWYPRKLTDGRWIWLQRYCPAVLVYHLTRTHLTRWFYYHQANDLDLYGHDFFQKLARGGVMPVVYETRAHDPIKEV